MLSGRIFYKKADGLGLELIQKVIKIMMCLMNEVDEESGKLYVVLLDRDYFSCFCGWVSTKQIYEDRCVYKNGCW